MNFTRSFLWLVPLMATSSLAQTTTPRIRIPRVPPKIVVIPETPATEAPVTAAPTTSETPPVIRRVPPVNTDKPPVIRPPIIRRIPPTVPQPPASSSGVPLFGRTPGQNLPSLNPTLTISQIDAFAKLVHNTPYEFSLDSGRASASSEVVPDSVDASVYSDGTSFVGATLKKMEIKSEGLADTFVLQFSEAGASSSMGDDSSPWDAPYGLVYYEPRGIALAPGGQANYTASFPINTQLLSRLAGKVDAANGKILYVRAVPVKTRTTIQKNILDDPILGGGGRGTTGRANRRGIRIPSGLNLPPARQRWQMVGQPTQWRSIYIAGTSTEVAALIAQKRQALLTVDLERLGNEVASRYKIEILSYIPPKIFDDSDFAVGDKLELVRDVSFKGRNWKKGQMYSLNHANNILNKKSGLAGLASDLYDLTTGTLDQFSGAWASVKGFAVDTIASALNASGILDCGAKCRAVISAGINIALAYCGIPPSIPNSRQLYAGGKEYLAGAAADAILEQATGVDSETFNEFGGDVLKKELRKKVMSATSQGIDTLVDQMGCPAPGQPDCGFKADNPGTWGVPSNYFRKRSGVMYVKISRVGAASDNESPAFLGMNFVRVPGDSSKKIEKVFYDTQAYKLFEIPDDGLIVPIVLTPTAESLKAKLWRINGYSNPYYTIGEPLTYYGQPWYDTGSSLLNGKVSIRTTHLVKSQYAQYPQCVLKEWIVDKKMSLANVTGVGPNPTKGNYGYYGEMPFSYAE